MPSSNTHSCYLPFSTTHSTSTSHSPHALLLVAVHLLPAPIGAIVQHADNAGVNKLGRPHDVTPPHVSSPLPLLILLTMWFDSDFLLAAAMGPPLHFLSSSLPPANKIIVFPLGHCWSSTHQLGRQWWQWCVMPMEITFMDTEDNY